MRRTNAESIGEILHHFYDEHPHIRQKLQEVRIRNAWGAVLGNMVMHATRNLYVKNGILYVSVNSSVLRNELMLNREGIVKRLNEYAGAKVIHDVVLR
ncbi:MAG: DUF721 domain-containing protein [Tannerella sp.]|jgi:predicted xylose isomerase-like sugar epimerase|nr:DUF721 domain-containing protein [Tannerella sp.]